MNGSAVTPLTTQDLFKQDELSILTGPANHLRVERLVSYYRFNTDCGIKPLKDASFGLKQQASQVVGNTGEQ